MFDDKFQFQDFDVVQVGTDAEIPSDATEALNHKHQKLDLEVEIEKQGYIYVYLSVDDKQNMDIYFDDLKVTHKLNDIVAGGDYYPFGSVMSGREVTRDDYRFGYQGQFSEYDDETGWNAFELRMYDSETGRFIVSDPYNQFFSSYIGMANNPISGVDPDGGYTPFGARWRSFLIPNSFYFYDVEVGEYSIGWYTKTKMGGVESALFNKIHEDGLSEFTDYIDLSNYELYGSANINFSVGAQVGLDALGIYSAKVNGGSWELYDNTASFTYNNDGFVSSSESNGILSKEGREKNKGGTKFTQSIGGKLYGFGGEISREYSTYYGFEGHQTGTEVVKTSVSTPTLLPPTRGVIKVDSDGNQKAGVKLSFGGQLLFGVKADLFLGIRRRR